MPRRRTTTRSRRVAREPETPAAEPARAVESVEPPSDLASAVERLFFDAVHPVTAEAIDDFVGADAFALEFPEGTVVEDQIAGDRFVVGATPPETPVPEPRLAAPPPPTEAPSPIAEPASADIASPTEPSPPPPREHTPWLVAGTALVAMAAASLLARSSW